MTTTTDDAPLMEIELPLPVGSNHRMVAVKDRAGNARLVRRKSAVKWAKTASWEVLAQRDGRQITNTRAKALILIGPSGFDADAMVKEVFDALQAGGAVWDDRLIREYAVREDPEVQPGYCVVRLWDTGTVFERTSARRAKGD